MLKKVTVLKTGSSQTKNFQSCQLFLILAISFHFDSLFNSYNELLEECKVLLANRDEELKNPKTRYMNMS